MDKDSRFPISASREPNVLRPYARPATIGPPPTAPPPQPAHAPRPSHSRAPPSSLSSAARDLLPELDLDLKTSAGEAWQNTRNLFDQLLYRYTSVLLAQPFDVAKVVLQVSLPPSAPTSTSQKRRASPKRHAYQASYDSRGKLPAYEEDEDEETDATEDSDDVPDYFTAAAPRSRSPRRRRRTPPSEELSPTPTPTPKSRRQEDPAQEYKLNLKRLDSITHAIGAVYQTSGAIGLWRGSNCTFLYNTLSRMTDSFIRSLLLALLGLPEIIGPDANGLASAFSVPGAMGLSGLDLNGSPNPIGSLVVVGLSSCLTGLLLAPLDVIRTRLIVAPTAHPPRGVLQNIRRLPSLLAPSELWIPTALAHAVPQLFSAAAPLVLRRQLKITPETTPGMWSLAQFCTCLTDLFLRLPLDTVLRRAQVASLKRVEPLMPTVIEPGPYAGVAGTIYSILYQEGEMRTKDAKGMVRLRKGQGTAGLVRGWRIGFWGLVGVWGAGVLGPGEGKGGRGEF
jgi:mitochondrial fusion and transport protein UGO1